MTLAGFADLLKDVEFALESLPNKVIDDVSVQGNFYKTSSDGTAIDSGSSGVLPSNILDDTNTDKFKNSFYLNITFIGDNVQGEQNLLTVKHILCGDGCTPKLTGIDLWDDTMRVSTLTESRTSGDAGATTSYDVVADFNSYECGRRGKCDYDTGICECFSGYTGLACGTITSLV